MSICIDDARAPRHRRVRLARSLLGTHKKPSRRSAGNRRCGQAGIEMLMAMPFFILMFVGVARFGHAMELRMHTQVASRHAAMRSVVGKPISSPDESRANIRGWPSNCSISRQGQSIETGLAAGGLSLQAAAGAGSIAVAAVLPSYLFDKHCIRYDATVTTRHVDNPTWPVLSLTERRDFKVISGNWSYKELGHDPAWRGLLAAGLLGMLRL